MRSAERSDLGGAASRDASDQNARSRPHLNEGFAPVGPVVRPLADPDRLPHPSERALLLIAPEAALACPSRSAVLSPVDDRRLGEGGNFGGAAPLMTVFIP